MQCPECGAVASAEDLFCGECGAILSAVPPEEPAIPPAADLPAEAVEAVEIDWPVEPPPPPAIGRPTYAPAARDSRATAAFVLGIASIVIAVLSCIPFISFFGCLGPIVGIVAIVLGVVAKRDIEARGGLDEDAKRAQQGLIMGAVGMGLYLIMVALGILLSVGISILGEL